MSEAGETSSSSWAKLVPIDSRLSDVEIKSYEHECEWCKIIRNPDGSSATIHNLSSSAIMVDQVVIESGEDGTVRCGSEIALGGGVTTYRFKVIATATATAECVQIGLEVANAKCGICLSVWHDAVTLAPCFHTFCNGCFSEWLRRHPKGVLCPHCRASVQFAGRNHFLHDIARHILKADPSLTRSFDELASLDSPASIQSNLVIMTGKRSPRKRSHSQVEDEDHPCPQCATQFNGFQCNPNTLHLQCQPCGGMMPSRLPNTAVPQHCLGCDRAFCGAYWDAQGVTTTEISSHAICSPHTLKPISERRISRIPFWAHEKNRHEQDITDKCIRHMGTTLEDVVAEWITKLNNREIDRTRMPLNHAEMITSGTHLCNDCYEKLVSFLLYWYRITLPKYVMPAEASAREDCWYGFGCRTQHHNEQHARRRNHVCRPTRASNNT